MRTTRADWSASCPWDGITGKPDFPGGVTDIGQLKAAGFLAGQIPVWNSILKKFLPRNFPSPTPTPSPTTQYVDPVQVEWDVPSLMPLQSVFEDFPYIGGIPATPCAVGVPFDMQFCWIRADIIANDTIRLTVTNLNSVAIDLGLGLYNVQPFQLAT